MVYHHSMVNHWVFAANGFIQDCPPHCAIRPRLVRLRTWIIVPMETTIRQEWIMVMVTVLSRKHPMKVPEPFAYVWHIFNVWQPHLGDVWPYDTGGKQPLGTPSTGRRRTSPSTTERLPGIQKSSVSEAGTASVNNTPPNWAWMCCFCLPCP